MIFKYDDGATPLNQDELADLIPDLTTQEELNAWEENNILKARQWGLSQREIVSVSFVKDLHRHMFNETWRWAGKFRTSEKNLGIRWHLISSELKKLCDDVSYQFEHAVYPEEEIALRFHHRLVWIHPFPNGNGRHGRLMADLLIRQHGYPVFSWGRHGDLLNPSMARKQYIDALQSADKGHYVKLIAFARS